MEIVDIHICKTCNKSYSSYSSLWNHNKNIHKNEKINVLETSHKVLETSHNIKKYNCRYCNKIYNNIKTRWGHEQKCKMIFDEKEKKNNEIKIAEINKEIKLAEIELEKFNSNKEIELEKFNSNKEIELAKINLELKKLEIKKKIL